MPESNYAPDTERFAKCIEVSKRVRWDIDQDVIRGREFDFSQKFLPDRISKLDQLRQCKSLGDEPGSLVRRSDGARSLGSVQR